MSIPAADHTSLRELAIRIWKAGVDAVDAERLVRDNIKVDERSQTLTVCGHQWSLGQLGQICVVGAGKAGAGMAAGVEAALGPSFVAEWLDGWVNVPENCVRSLAKIHLHGARPAGVNEPTEAGVSGTEEILRRVSALQSNDLCLVLMSGGGSALLPAPVAGVTLSEKLSVTRFLSQSGATIQELNTVRKAISQVKGGGLARACSAGIVVSLIISDVIGDPLSIIASGPTLVEPVNFAGALTVLRKFDPQRTEVPVSIWRHIESLESQPVTDEVRMPTVFNHVIGNNRVAVEAAAAEARHVGAEYVRILAIDQPGVASETGVELAKECIALLRDPTRRGLTCIISGGEPVVRLNPSDKPRKGGRNQELVLAALAEFRTSPAWQVEDAIRVMRTRSELMDVIQAGPLEFDAEQLISRLGTQQAGVQTPRSVVYRMLAQLTEAGLLRQTIRAGGRDFYHRIPPTEFALLSGGTDGEDGPTDAAGAFVDSAVLQKTEELGLDPAEFLAINNAYEFFEKTGGLLITGPTHTNVMDLRVALVQT